MAGRPIADTASLLHAAVERGLSASPRRPFVIGVSGAQGSGKSTLARTLTELLNAEGRRAAHISLDDFYLSRAKRRDLAARVHPLFVTRGPPGTHDVNAALAVLASVKAGKETLAPRFDKARDEPLPLDQIVPACLQTFIFEGWCLGAKPQSEEALAVPVNMLESIFDRDGVWRRAVNEALGGSYQTLFSELDLIAYLRAPNFDIIRCWRIEQEDTLAASLPPGRRAGLMTPDEISFFIQYFERITKAMMDDLPSRADLTLQLDERRRVTSTITQDTDR